MGLIRLVLVYALCAGLLAWLARALRCRPSPLAIAALTLAPLLFTGAGFLPGQTLFDAGWLATGPPWRDAAAVGVAMPTEHRPQLFDTVSQNEPWRAAVRRDPLFSPATGAGASLIGNPQSAVFFPLELAARLVPLPRAGTFTQAAKLLVGGWGMFVLLRRRRLPEIAALIGAWTWIGAGFFHFWRAQTPANVAACLPWLALALLTAWRQPSRRAIAGLAVAAAAALLAGYPQTLAQASVCFVLVLTATAPAGRQRGRRLRRGVGALGAGSLLALLLAAPVLLPFAELLPTAREWVRASHESRNPPPEALGASLAHLAKSALFATGEPNRGEHPGGGDPAQAWAPLAALAMVPAALAGRRRRRELIAWLAVGLGALAIGARLPGIYHAAHALPLLSSTVLGRWGFFWPFALALLAAHGWAAARRGRRRDRRPGRRALALGALLVVGVVGGALALASDRAAALGPAGLAMISTVLLLAAAAATARSGASEGKRRGEPGGGSAAADPPAADRSASDTAAKAAALHNLRPSAATTTTRQTSRPNGVGRLAPAQLASTALLAAAALLAPAVWQLGRWIPATPIAAYYPPTPALAFLVERAAGSRVSGLGDALFPHAAALYGLEDIRSYDATMFEPYRQFLELYFGAHYPGWVVLHPAAHVFEFLNVRYLVDAPGRQPMAGADAVYRGADATIFAVHHPQERLFAPRRLRFDTDRRRAGRVLATATDLADLALVHATAPPRPSGPTPAGPALTGPTRNGRATLHDLRLTSGRIEVHVDADAATFLLATQPAIPGWKVWVDGERVLAVPANLAFFGFWVPAGAHRVELRYLPDSFLVGLGGALVASFACAGLTLAGRRKRPSPP